MFATRTFACVLMLLAARERAGASVEASDTTFAVSSHIGPVAAMREFDVIARRGDVDAVEATYLAVNPKEQALAHACAAADIALARLQQAAAERFGFAAAENAIHATGQKTVSDLPAATLTYDGDQVKVEWADGTKLPLVQVGTGWRVSLAQMLKDMTNADADRFKLEVDRLSAGLSKLADETDAGTIIDSDSLTRRVERLSQNLLNDEGK